MANSILDNIMTLNWEPTIHFGDILKIPLVLVLVVCLFYSFVLFLKARILIDTVESEGNSKIKALALINLLISVVFTLVGTIIIVLG